MDDHWSYAGASSGGRGVDRVKLKNPPVGIYEYFLEQHIFVALPLDSALKDK